ncbi:hypothetical protein ALC57_15552 [Trachymyrmex cornetzi]|uniref:Uncharacterized protein n=1 Tax=Trachymyrmex cornetzi TaxID=471704 RepID=A0A151IWX2_9HYME|nr:hypothetical protein ALC57_15552 [Trachymyrmex cornetzi]
MSAARSPHSGGAHDGAARKTPEPKRRNRTAATFSRQVSRRGLESSRKCSQALGGLGTELRRLRDPTGANSPHSPDPPRPANPRHR